MITNQQPRALSCALATEVNLRLCFKKKRNTIFFINDQHVINTNVHKTTTMVDQSVYEKYGPNLQKIATEMKPFDLTSYIYCL